MKNYILLFCFMMGSGLMMGQVKVNSNGYTKIGITGTAPLSQLHVQDLGTNATTWTMIRASTLGNIARIGVESATNSGFTFTTGGVERWAPAAFQANAGKIDFTFWNIQNSRASLLIDGDTDNATFTGTVRANGILLTSDKRLKKNIKAYEGALEKVMNIRPVTFNYIDQKENNTFLGVVAQELQKVEPMLVSSNQVNTYNEKMEVTSSEEYLAIQADAVQYMLVSAIQEQQKMIETLKSEIESLTKIIGTGRIGNIDAGSSKDIVLSDLKQSLLGQNEPNPYVSQTTISYSIGDNVSSAVVNFFNLKGQLIKSVDVTKGAGKLNISSDDLASGTYVYSLVTDGTIVETKKMIVEK